LAVKGWPRAPIAAITAWRSLRMKPVWLIAPTRPAMGAAVGKPASRRATSPPAGATCIDAIDCAITFWVMPWALTALKRRFETASTWPT
jgi:hypothetical protein